MEQKIYVVIAAGGYGNRMRTTVPKQFLPLDGVPLIVRTIEAFYEEWPEAVFIVAMPEDEFPRWERVRKKFLKKVHITTTKGGATRFHSVKNSLKFVKEEGMVLVQDACRPLLSEALLKKCFQTATAKGNAVPVVELKDSIREVIKDGSRHRDRARFKIVQTPQCFSTAQLKKAYQQTFNESFTDDASVVEAAGFKINLVEGESDNLKITTPLDLEVAELMLKG